MAVRPAYPRSALHLRHWLPCAGVRDSDGCDAAARAVHGDAWIGQLGEVIVLNVGSMTVTVSPTAALLLKPES